MPAPCRDAPPPTTAAPEPVPDARFTLLGVVSPRSPQAAREGLALIAVEGKPPRAYRVGAVVDGGPHVLQGVSARGATLGPREGAPAISLNLAPPAPAATGTLPPSGFGAVPVPVPQQPPGAGLPPRGALPPPGVQPSVPQPVPLPLPPQQQTLPQGQRESNLR
jgi:general secretion pathway protein C